MDNFSQYHVQIREEAMAAWPNEAIWFITKKGCQLVENIADDPENDFEVSQKDYIAADKKGLLALVHSHPDAPPVPSLPDMLSQADMNIPWGIVACGADYCSLPMWFGEGAPRLPLMDRPFAHGVCDCYSFIRDWYREELDILLPDYPRGWEWWKEEGAHSNDFYQTKTEPLGFHTVSIEEARRGDLIMFRLKSKKVNHAAVYLGGGLLAHHLTAELSYDPTRRPAIQPVSRWMTLIHAVYRHKDSA